MFMTTSTTFNYLKICACGTYAECVGAFERECREGAELVSLIELPSMRPVRVGGPDAA